MQKALSKEALKYSFFLVATILIILSFRPSLYLIRTFFNIRLPIFLEVLNIVFLPTGSVGLRLSTPPEAITDCLAGVGASAGRSADNGIIIGGCEGVEIPFCKSASRKGIGWALWRALKYEGDDWVPGRGVRGGGGGAGCTGDDESLYKGCNI